MARPLGASRSLSGLQVHPAYKGLEAGIAAERIEARVGLDGDDHGVAFVDGPLHKRSRLFPDIPSAFNPAKGYETAENGFC